MTSFTKLFASSILFAFSSILASSFNEIEVAKRDSCIEWLQSDVKKVTGKKLKYNESSYKILEKYVSKKNMNTKRLSEIMSYFFIKSQITAKGGSWCYLDDNWGYLSKEKSCLTFHVFIEGAINGKTSVSDMLNKLNSLIKNNKNSKNNNMDNLIVYGKDWSFLVKEPPGYRSDIDVGAKYGFNIVFYDSNYTFNTSPTAIGVHVFTKSDEDIQKDLDFDMNKYRKEHPKIKFKDNPVTHPEYKCYTKLYTVEKNFYEYVAYLNPGKDIPWVLSVSMNKQKNPADKKELKAYQGIIKSITFYLSIVGKE